jgi:Serpentine type 7TM GPCR chemoreceptor Str
MERQVTLTMLVQTALPLLMQLTPKFLLIYFKYANSTDATMAMSVYSAMMYSLVPVLNPLINIAMIAAYRGEVASILVGSLSPLFGRPTSRVNVAVVAAHSGATD